MVPPVATRARTLLAILALALGAAGCRGPSRTGDPGLAALTSELVCRLEAARCASPRVALRHDAALRAELHADGTLRIADALLAQTRDASEAAFVLAHELAHDALGHHAARAAGADEQTLERAADDWALARLAARGFDASAGGRLLARLVSRFEALDAARVPASALAGLRARASRLGEGAGPPRPAPDDLDARWRAALAD